MEFFGLVIVILVYCLVLPGYFVKKERQCSCKKEKK
jgi:hypothetical protein